MTLPPYFFVFDVESIGLHGEGFAVGFCIVDTNGVERTAECLWVDPAKASGTNEGREWVKANVPDPHRATRYPDIGSLREAFWGSWVAWKELRAVLVADCPWPVESRFLSACVDHQPEARQWQGPYPLIDVASVRFAAGLDPLGTELRLPGELPAHDPLADARQSGRLLIEALGMVAK